MLQVSKKAATEAEAEAILQASHQVEKPFGVPVMIVDPTTDFPRKKIFGVPLYRPVTEIVQQKLAVTLAQCDPAKSSDKALTWERNFFLKTPEQIEETVIGTLKEYWQHGDSYLACAMPNASPHMSVVLHSSVDDAARTGAAFALFIDKKKLPDYPGFDAQHNFSALWHEIAHSVAGDNEAGADHTSALASRYAFEDCTFLKVEADIRAINAVYYSHVPKILDMYGWPCVDALDSVIALENAPSWEDVKEAGEKAHLYPRRSRMQPLMEVGKTLKEKAKAAFDSRDLGALAKISQKTIEEGCFDQPEQKMIAERFALAAHRLSIGTPAYQFPVKIAAPVPA